MPHNPRTRKAIMHTRSLTPREHLAHLLIMPPVRVRLRWHLRTFLQQLHDSREAVMLPLGVTFWAVFVILSALGCCAR